MPQVRIDVPDHTWEQVLELAAHNWRSARDQISVLVIAAATTQLERLRRYQKRRPPVDKDPDA